MAFLIPDPALARVRCTVTHLDPDPLGVRLVESPTSPLVLAVAPWARLSTLIEGLNGLRIATYILTGAAYPEGCFLRLYIGETGALRERLRRHARDPRKAFTSTIYALTSRDPGFGKSDVAALQFLLDRHADVADRGMIVRGAPPVPPEIDAAAWARAEAWIAQARYLLAAAGCVLLEPRVPSAAIDPSGSAATAASAAPSTCPIPAMPGRMSVARAAPLTPDIGSRTYVLARGDLWAMAVEVDGRLIIRAGSEMSRGTIASCDPSTRSRREALERAAFLTDVPGRSDRWRLLRDAPVSSLTGAVRILTGSHAGRTAWRLLPAAQPTP